MTDDATGPDPTRSPGGRSWRVPLLVGAAVLAIIVVVAVVVGGKDDNSTDASADPTTGSTSSASTSPSASESASSAAPSTVPSPSAGDPTPSPIIDKAVRAAMKDDFPALVPSGVPGGWTVVSATYDAAAGGTWRIDLTDPTGAEVVLVQAKAPIEQLVTEYLGPDGLKEGKVDLTDYGTGVWTGYGAMDSHGIAKRIAGTSALVYAPTQAPAVTLAQDLLTAEDANLPEAG